MTLGGIKFGGLASGLDTGAIIDAILAVEGRSLRVLEDRKGVEQQKLSLLGTFEGLVSKLRDKVKDLQTASNFFAHKLQVGEEGIASFTLSGSAQAGAHSLEVLSLASADRYAFTGVSDPSADLGSGTVSFSYGGNDYSVNVTAGSGLDDIAAAINAAAGDDVTATIVNVGTSASPSHQLVLAGNDTGADFTITGLASSVAGLTGATQVSVAANASVKIDGLSVQRSSNLFSDVLPGISFTVSRVTTVDTPVSFTVELDPGGIKENIQEFVDAYNAVADFIDKQDSFSTEGGPGGPLFSDNALDAVRSNLRRVMFTPSAAALQANPDYSSFGLMGIDLGSDGRLKINETRLNERLSGDLDAFADFFNGTDDPSTTTLDESGAFLRIQEMLDDLTKDTTAVDGKTKIEGLFHARKSAINRQIKDFDKESERLQFRLDKLEESLTLKFASLEQLLGGLQSQQAFLNANSFNINKR